GQPLISGTIPAEVFHYGWVKPPEFQKAKLGYFHRLWHDESWMEKKKEEISRFDYSGIDSLARFMGTHPAVMEERIRGKNWTFSYDPSEAKLSVKKRLLHWFEKKTGIRVGEFKNYRISSKVRFKD
ncbi:MAG: hypothetical protein ACM3N9_06575, partial [Syntrophothermus sp.]